MPFLFLNYFFPFYRETGQNVSINGKNYKVYDRIVDRQAIFYSVAASYLGIASGFSCGPNVSIEYAMNPVYFHHLGTPAGPVRTIKTGMHGRYYSGGFVVISQSEGTVYIEMPPGLSKVNDLHARTAWYPREGG